MKAFAAWALLAAGAGLLTWQWWRADAQEGAAPAVHAAAGTTRTLPGRAAGASATRWSWAGAALTAAPPASAAPDPEPARADPAEEAARAADAALPRAARGLRSDASSGGLRVAATPPGSMSSIVGIHPGDVIVSVDGERVGSAEEYAELFRTHGLPRELTVLRDGQEVRLR